MSFRTSANRGYGYKTDYWTARQWLAIFGMLLVVWGVIYLISHSSVGVQGYEYKKFSNADIRHINSILVNPVDGSQVQYSDFSSKQRVTNTNDGFLDSYTEDSTELVPYISEHPETNYINNTSDEYERQARIRKASVYISSQYDKDIDEAQLHNILRYISTFNPTETGIFLADYNLKVKSFFWLSGPLVYAEIVFWTIFGVLCSLLLLVGNHMRKDKEDTHTEILAQAARLLYAPIACIILLLIYNYLKGGGAMDTRAGGGTIIFSFLLGFYSGTVMDFFDRVRNILFNTNKQETIQSNTIHKQPTPQPAPTYTAPVGSVPVQEPVQHDEENNHYEAKEEHTETQQQPELLQDDHVSKKTTLNEDNELAEVDIDLKLDLGSLQEEERNQLQKMGFSKAIVTLHNVNGKDIIPAKKLNDDMTTFVAESVKPGIYIARATLSQRLRDDNIINLFGEKTAYITEDKPGLELYVKKYTATD